MNEITTASRLEFENGHVTLHYVRLAQSRDVTVSSICYLKIPEYLIENVIY